MASSFMQLAGCIGCIPSCVEVCCLPPLHVREVHVSCLCSAEHICVHSADHASSPPSAVSTSK
ncbi:hypothetical protein ACQJBY_068490 [Aegilops geniculata]